MKKEFSLEKIETVVGKILGKAVKEITAHTNTKINGLNAKIVGLAEIMMDRFEEVDVKFDRIENQLDRVSDDIRLISTHVGLDLRKV